MSVLEQILDELFTIQEKIKLLKDNGYFLKEKLFKNTENSISIVLHTVCPQEDIKGFDKNNPDMYHHINRVFYSIVCKRLKKGLKNLC